MLQYVLLNICVNQEGARKGRTIPVTPTHQHSQERVCATLSTHTTKMIASLLSSLAHTATNHGQVLAPAPAAADSRLRLMYRAYQASRPKLMSHNNKTLRKEVNPEFHMMMIVLSSVR